MGILDRWKPARKRPQECADARREAAASPTDPEATTSSPPRISTGALAGRLSFQYPDEVPSEVLAEAAAAEGLDAETVRQRIESDRQAEPLVVRPRRVKVDELRVMDLSGLNSVRMRIKGSSYSVSDAERRRQGGPEYLLIPEADNEVDPTAVAVYGMKGRRVGYVSATRGAMLSPLFAQLDADAFKVTGAGATKRSIVLSVDVPKADALRRFVREVTG